jgi:hypothetical protein
MDDLYDTNFQSNGEFLKFIFVIVVFITCPRWTTCEGHRSISYIYIRFTYIE